MHYEFIKSLKAHNPALRIISSDSAPLLLSFFHTLSNLTEDEQRAYSKLLPGGDCEGLRIEQERVPFQSVLDALKNL